MPLVPRDGRDHLQDPAVVKLINDHFIAVKVDQDANPALSQRYEDWGWPATVMFDGKGRELNKERGYVEPAAMAQVLQALVDKPEPMPEMPVSKPAALALLTQQQKQVLGDRLEAAYDVEHGGWGNRHKFLQADALDYLLLNASAGDATARERARQTCSTRAPSSIRCGAASSSIPTTAPGTRRTTRRS